MSLSSNFPTIKPSMSLDFANAGRLDPRVTFTRATTATYYDGVTTAKAEENLLVQSQDFTTTWVPFELAVTANTTTAPDGTSTADTLNDGIATNVHDIQQTVVTTTGTTYTMSAFLKNVDRQYAILACAGSVNSYASAKFDLAAGTLGSTQASGSGWSVVSSTITSVGNSWYRCTLTFVVGSTTGSSFRVATATDGTTFTPSQRGEESYTGTNASIYVWGAQLEQRSSVTAYTATTTQAITNYVPVLLTAQNNVPRFDHNPTTGAALGLLIEEQRTNLVTYSAEFDNAAWTKTRVSITANTIVAPDGNLVGDKIIETTDSGVHLVSSNNITVSIGSVYTFSIFAKAGERNLIGLGDSSGSSIGAAIFNLSTGAVTFTQSGGSSTITPVGNGWYRCTYTSIAAIDTTINYAAYLTTSTTSINSYAGDGYSGLYVFGAQVEAGAFATSYIPTTTTALTRNADVASMTGTNFSSWYNQSEGTVFVQASRIYSGGRLFMFDDGSTNNRWEGRLTNNVPGINSWSSNVQDVNISNGGSLGDPSSTFKAALANKTNDAAISVNGLTPTTDTNCTMPTGQTRLFIGSFQGTATFANGYIQRISFWPVRLANSQLQALTS